MKYYTLLASILLSTGICYSQRSVNNMTLNCFILESSTLLYHLTMLNLAASLMVFWENIILSEWEIRM